MTTHRHILAFLALVLLCLPAWTAFAQNDRLSAAVLDLEAIDVDAELTSTLTSIVRNEAQQLETYKVVNKFEINFRDILLVIGCSTESTPCLKQVADEVNARVLIFGNLAKLDDAYRIELRIFDSESGRMINELSKTIPDSTDPVVTFRKEIASFFGTNESLPTTRIRIGSNVNDARILLEDTHVGTVPLERKGLPPGRYNVKVVHDDYETWETAIELREGADVELWAPLKPVRRTTQPPAAEPGSTAQTTKNQNDSVVVSDGIRDDDGSSGINWGAWSAISVGAASLVGSGIFALLMLDAESQISDENDAGTLTESRYQELVDRGEGYELTHRILLGVGAVGLISGLVWLMIDSGSSSTALQIGPTGPTQVGASLRW